MSFIAYDLSFLVVFVVGTFLFLHKNRKNLKREGIMYLYRTSIGIKIIDSIAKRFRKIMKPLQYVIIACGYFLMSFMLYTFINLAYVYIKSPTLARDLKVPVLTPLLPYVDRLFPAGLIPPFYFTYWIIIIAVIAIPHEFAHGIYARFHKIKVHSTGFGFLGPLLAAFVEPDEKQMNKLKKVPQLSILAAGTFANVLSAIFFVFVLWAFFAIAFTPSGIIFNTYSTSSVNVSSITMINGLAYTSLAFPISMQNLTLIKVEADNKTYYTSPTILEQTLSQKLPELTAFDDSPALRANLSGAITEFNGQKISSLDQLKEEITSHNPGDTVTIKTFSKDSGVQEYSVTLGERDGKAFLGIGNYAPQRSGLAGLVYRITSKIKDPFTYYNSSLGDFGIFIYDLLWWLVVISFSVAVFNMVPMGLFDGGRFFYITIFGITGSKNAADWIFKATNWFLLLLVAALMLKWVFIFF